jgi:hypothetical protein
MSVRLLVVLIGKIAINSNILAHVIGYGVISINGLDWALGFTCTTVYALIWIDEVLRICFVNAVNWAN